MSTSAHADWPFMGGAVIHSVYPSHNFERIDESDDAAFYSTPRLVVHIDEGAIHTIGEILSKLVPRDAEILDLMSSWRSHIPAELHPKRVVGLGMNATEMQENEQLSEWLIHDLNRTPRLPIDDSCFDVVLNTVSIQYMTQPVAVFQEVRRVLRPGGRFIVFFSNRMFPTKAVQAWRDATESERIQIVQDYFRHAGGFGDSRVLERHPAPVKNRSRLNWLALSGDPLYAVSAVRI